MKKQSLILLFCCAIAALLLSSCASAQHDASTPPTSEVGSSVMSNAEFPTVLNIPENFQVWRDPDAIRVYPFTEESLLAAVELAQKTAAEIIESDSPEHYEIKKVAFEPALTDAYNRQQMSGKPVKGWAEEDYYARYMTCVVFYDAGYDHTTSPMPDAEDGILQVTLTRENASGSWSFVEGSQGFYGGTYSSFVLTLEELAEVPFRHTGRLLGGYCYAGDACYLYACDDATGEVRFYDTQGNSNLE